MVALSQNSKLTYKITGTQFNNFLIENKIESITLESLKEFFQVIGRAWSANTLCKKFTHLMSIFESQQHFNLLELEAIRKWSRHNIGVNVSKSSEAITRDKYLTKEQIESLKLFSDYRSQLIIDFLFQSGCRISEMLDIKLKDIKNNGYATITVMGKGRKTRKVFVKKSLVESIVKEYESNEYLFESRKATKRGYITNRKYNRVTIFRKIKAVCKKYNKSNESEINISAHTLRHSCAMHLKLMGKDAEYISNYLGHTNVETTYKYYFHSEMPAGEEITGLF